MYTAQACSFVIIKFWWQSSVEQWRGIACSSLIDQYGKEILTLWNIPLHRDQIRVYNSKTLRGKIRFGCVWELFESFNERATAFLKCISSSFFVMISLFKVYFTKHWFIFNLFKSILCICYRSSASSDMANMLHNLNLWEQIRAFVELNSYRYSFFYE